MKKDIKTKPTNTKPKILEKASNIPKDAKSIMREHLISQAESLKPEFKDKSQQNETDYATGKIEEAADHARYEATRATGKAKDFTVQKIKEHRAEKAAQKQQENETPNEQPAPENNPELQSGEQGENAPKTKENYQQSQNENSNASTPQERGKEFAQQQQADRIKTKDSVLNSEKSPTSANEQTMPIKTKEDYIKAQGKEQIHEIDKSPKTLKSAPKGKVDGIKTKADISAETSDTVPVSKIKAKEYVMKKQEAKKQADLAEQRNTANANISSTGTGEHSAPKNTIKTKEQYRLSENGGNTKETIKTKKSDIKTFDRKGTETARLKSRANVSKQTASGKGAKEAVVNAKIKQKQTAKGTIKTRAGNISKSKSAKATKGIKTSKRMLKKSNPAKIAQKKAVAQARKKAAKKAAQEAARRTAQAAKATAHAIKVIAVKAAQLIAAAAKAVGSAIAALGGWAVLLILLIIVIIVAAIAASPFGIFISDEAADHDSIPISSIVAECNVELSQKLTDIEDSTTHDRVVMEGEQADWGLVLSVFSVKVAGAEDDTVQDVVIIDDAKKQKLKDVFWDMNNITSRTETVTSGETSETVLYITITAKTKNEMISMYNFSSKQKEALDTLLENTDAYIGATQSLAISDATAKEILQALPDSLSAERKAVIKAACSLVGKVNYFWGGKSAAIGWDSEWGKLKLVTAEGSRSSGSMRPFGLDCSGFVTWSFINSGFNASAIGHGTQSQVAKGTRISLSSAQPGDLAFFDDVSHVGIVAGKDASGNVLVIHCSSSANNVVITTGGFGFAVRPNCY